jgi:predicted metal-binding protein
MIYTMKPRDTTEKKYSHFLKRIVELGATEAKIIESSSVVTAEWVRLKCQYGCGGYGTTYCCPPHTPRPEETRQVMDCYKKAILAHFGRNVRVTKTMVELEKEVFLAGYFKAFSFGAGPCSLCKSCPEEGCKNPESARPSMEGCGIDVFSTARNNGYPIEVLCDRSCTGNYYGLLLIE